MDDDTPPAPNDAPVESDAGGAGPDEHRRGTVRILGTGHVFPLRNAVQGEVFDLKPDVVALELDPARLESLLMPEEERTTKGQGIGYGLMAKFQQRVAADFGGDVGDEMLAAREAGMLVGARIALIDRPVQQTYKRLMAELTWGERLRLLGSAVLAFLPGPWMKEDIDRVLEGDPTLIEEVGDQYPNLMRVLLHERNEHMARALVVLSGSHERVLAVMGDAHVPGVRSILDEQGIGVDVVRLPELLERAEHEKEHVWTVEVEDEPGTE